MKLNPKNWFIPAAFLVIAYLLVFNVFGQRPPLKAISSLDEIETENLFIARCFKGGQDDDTTHLNRGGKFLMDLVGLVATGRGTFQTRDDASAIIYSDEKGSLSRLKEVLLRIEDSSMKMNLSKEPGCVRLKRYKFFVKELGYLL